MPDFKTITLFALAALVLNATPGPAMLYVLSHSLAKGKKAGYASALGLATGSCFHVVLNALGLAFIFSKYHYLYIVVKTIGAAYLLFLGAKYIINSRKELDAELAVESSNRSSSLFVHYKKGIIVEFLNPKTALFYISFLPAFVNKESGSMAGQMLILGALVPFTALLSDFTVAYFADLFKQKILSGRFQNRYHERVSGVLLTVMGVVLLIT